MEAKWSVEIVVASDASSGTAERSLWIVREGRMREKMSSAVSFDKAPFVSVDGRRTGWRGIPLRASFGS